MGKPKFGVFLPFYAIPANCPPQQRFHLLQEIVLEVEQQGYDSIWLDDHLMYGEWPILECWTTLMALAASTSKIRLGTMVSCNAHRTPALLAKIASTFDVLSNGRLEFGIGSGIQESEHIAYGFRFPKPSIRTEQLSEALEVITGLWTKEKVSYQGKHYSLKDAVCEPKPAQKPHPPITVGGAGEKTLEVTAKYAKRFDWGFLPLEQYMRKLDVLERQCNAFGRSFDNIEKSYWPAGQILLAQDRAELNEKIGQRKPADMCLKDYKKYTLASTSDECKAQLQDYIDLGVSYFMLYFADLPEVDSLRLFSSAVVDKL